MMKYIKIALMYYSIVVMVGILSTIISRDWFGIVGMCIAILAALAAFFHIGIIIPNKTVKKKYFIYIVIIISETLLTLLLSVILGVGLRDTWLASISMGIIFLTILIILLDIGRFLKDTHPNVTMTLYIFFFIGLVMLLGNILITVFRF